MDFPEVLTDIFRENRIKSLAVAAYERIVGRGVVQRYHILRSGPMRSPDGVSWEVGMMRPLPTFPLLCLARVTVTESDGSCEVKLLSTIKDAMNDRWHAYVEVNGKRSKESDADKGGAG